MFSVNQPLTRHSGWYTGGTLPNHQKCGRADLQTQIHAFYQHIPFIFARFQVSPNIFGNALSTLEEYDNRLTTTQLPLTAIAVQIAILLLWFLIATTDLLLDREEQTLAILRSRGAYARQLLLPLLSFLMPAALVSSLIGPYLAALIVGLFPSWPQHLLKNAPPVHMDSPQRLFAMVGWYSVGTSAVALFVCVVALYRRMRTTIVGIRRRASRNSHSRFWRRYPLDIVTAVALLLLYASYTYFIAPSLGSALATRMAPLALYTPIVALSAATIVVFRFLPLCFGWLAALSKRGRGVTPVVAATSLAHAQRRTHQASIFLALVVALCCFLTAYQATLTQHNQEYAAFQVGADFSFALPIDTAHIQTATQQEDRFRRIPGVEAASAGAIIDITSPTDTTARDRIVAVDAATYASVSMWPNPSSGPAESMSAFLQKMSQLRAGADARGGREAACRTSVAG